MHQFDHHRITLAVFTGLLVITAAFAPTPRQVLACTPPPGGLRDISVGERTQAADFVVVGEVTALNDADGIPGATAAIQVRQYLKGSGPDQLIATGYGPAAVCRSELQAGDIRIFYLVHDGTGGLRALYLSQFDAIAPATAFLISQVTAAADTASAQNDAAAAVANAAPAAQPNPYPYPQPATPTVQAPTMAPPTFVPPTFAPATPTLPGLAAPTETLTPIFAPPTPPDMLPTIGIARASESGVPIPQTSLGIQRNIGTFSFITGALFVAGGIAYLRRRYRAKK